MIKAVVFDLDGVYFEDGTEVFIEKLIHEFRLTEELVKEVYFRSSQMSEYKSGKITGKEFWDWAIETWGIQTSMETVIELLISSYSVRSEVQNYVKELKARGLKTAICTNNFPERLNGLKKAFQLESYFDSIIASFEIGITKPNKEIFDELSKALRCEPSEIIMSDDKEDNVKALQQLGFNAIGYTNWDAFVNEVEELIKQKGK